MRVEHQAKRRLKLFFLFSFFLLFFFGMPYCLNAQEKYPIFYETGFIQQDNESHLMLYSLTPFYQQPRPVSKIVKVTEQRIDWEYVLSSYEIKKFCGLQEIQFIPDVNGDGINDVLAVLNPIILSSAQQARILVISGLDGQTLWQTFGKDAVSIKEAFPIDDLNEDGCIEIIVKTEEYLCLLDGSKGQIIKSWPCEEVVLPAGDANKDGIDDLFFLSEQKLRLGLFNNREGIGLYFIDLHIDFEGVIDIDRCSALGDQNRDGVVELFLTRQLEDKTIQAILSGIDGKLIWVYEDKSGFEGKSFISQNAGVDFNLNGSLDIILFGEDERIESRLQVIDGKDGNVLWTYRESNGSGGLIDQREIFRIPACVVDDLNNDGIPELAVSKAAEAGRGLTIEFYDIAGGWTEPYKVLTIQGLPAGELNRNWDYGLPLQNLVWSTEANYLVITTFGSKGEERMLIIYDYKAGQPIAFLPHDYRKIAPVAGGSVLAEDSQGQVAYYKIITGGPAVQVKPKEEKFSLWPLSVELEWNYAQEAVVTRIYVDNVLALETNEDSAEIKLPRGNHLIAVAQYFSNGEVTLQQIPMNLANNFTSWVFGGLLVATGLALLFGLPALMRIFMRMGVKNVWQSSSNSKFKL